MKGKAKKKKKKEENMGPRKQNPTHEMREVKINNKSKSAGKILLHSSNPPTHAKAEGR